MSNPKIVTPDTFVQTTNGKEFYFNSGEITVTDSETTMIEIERIGERDAKLNFVFGCDTIANDNPTIQIYIDDIKTFETQLNYTYTQYLTGVNEMRLIVPANSKLKITMKMSANSYHYFLTGYGRYLRMD